MRTDPVLAQLLILCSPFFFFLFYASPRSKHAAIPTDFSCQLLKRKRGRWAEGDPGREQRNGRKNRWQALTKGRTLCLARRCGVTGPWGREGNNILSQENRKVKDGATLTFLVVNTRCRQMSYGSQQKQLVWKRDKDSMLRKDIVPELFRVLGAAFVIFQ